MAVATGEREVNGCTLRDRLRSDTASAHARAESIIGALANPAEADGYQRFLTAHLAMYRRYGDALDRMSAVLSLPARADDLIKALESDLANVDERAEMSPALTTGASRYLSAGSASVMTVTDAATAIDLRSSAPSQLLGIAYVLEGSANGAMVIRSLIRKRRDTGGRHDVVPAQFVQALCDDRRYRWPVVAAHLAAARPPAADVALAIEAADGVFVFLSESVEAMGTMTE